MDSTLSLFPEQIEELLPGFFVLRQLADPQALAAPLASVCEHAPPYQMSTPRGFVMSAAMTSCGAVGWVSDRQGYRYSPVQLANRQSWPAMPPAFRTLANHAAAQAGFDGFAPDTCLINRYLPGTQMGAHQDSDEADFDAPIVSVSLGIAARFFMLGAERRGRSTSVDVMSGDVVVFGGPARCHFHGVRKLKPAIDPLFGAQRWNLTFRQAL